MPVKIGEAAANVGINAANSALGGVLGMAFAGANDRRQIKQQTKLQNLQIAGNKEMTDYQYAKQLQMWKDTNYSAQVAELKKAGLNEGLLYGMSGGGGTTTGSGGGNVTGATAGQGGGGEITAGMGLQLGLQASQMKLMEAQARNLDADTKKKSGVETELGYANIDNIRQQTSNAKVQQLLDRTKLALDNLDLYIKDEGKEYSIIKIQQEASKLIEEVDALGRNNDINQQEFENLKKAIELDVANKAIDIEAKRAKINLDQTTIAEITQSMWAQLQQLKMQGRSLDQKDIDLLIDQERNKLINKGIEWGAAATVLNGIIDVWKFKSKK